MKRAFVNTYIAQEPSPQETKTTAKEVVMTASELTKACWFTDQKHFMMTGIFPAHISPKKKRFYRMKNSGHRLVEGVLF